MYRKILVAVLFISFLGLMPQKAFSASGTSDSLCKLGVSLYNERQYERALTTFKKALALDPDNKTARRYINNIFKSDISPAGSEKMNFAQKKAPAQETVSRDEIRPAQKEEKSPVPAKPPRKKAPLEKKAKTTDTDKAKSPLKISGEARLGLGFTPEGAIWKDANADRVGVPREKNWRYLWGKDRYNTYDSKIYDRLVLDMQTQFDSPLNAFLEINIDPWTFIGKNHVTLVSANGTDVVDMDLKYWSNDHATINETYRSRTGQILHLKEIKVHDGRTELSGVTIAPNNTTFNAVSEMDINRKYRPIRKFWVDYKQDDYALKFFPISDQFEALTSDDPLSISNAHAYWQESPWLDSYEPSTTFERPGGARWVKTGRWVRKYSYIARDSSDDYPHRLTFLRGLSLKADTGSYTLDATIATPMNLWDEYYRSNSLHSALRLKVPLNSDLEVGFTTTNKAGINGGSFEAWNQVQALDASYQIIPYGKIYAQAGGSHTEIEQSSEGFTTKYDGMAGKLGFNYDASKEKKDSGLYKGEAYFAYVDGSFYPALTDYSYTRTDDVSFSKHVYFSEINPADKPLMFGDGIDRNRVAAGLTAGLKAFEEKLDADLRLRNVHSIGGRYIETVSRAELTYKVTPKLTSKLLTYYKHLPETDANYDPLLYVKTMYSLVDYFTDQADFHPRNAQVIGNVDPSIGAFGTGLKYDFFDELSAEAIYEYTNDPLDFPRGLFNDVTLSTMLRDGHTWDAVEPFLYDQQLFDLPPYNYYSIFKTRLAYQPFEELKAILSYTYNENRYTTGMDDNVNHLGFEVNYKPMDKWSFWLKYVYSRLNDVYKQMKFGGSDFYERHHNVFFGTEYQIDADSTFTLLYGEFVGYNNPYQQSAWTLSTLDTQHIFRLFYKRKF